MSEKVRIGLVGCGGIARRHADGLSALPEAEFVACCDVVEERAKKMAEDHNVPRVFTDADELFKSGEVDAVTICTPHPAHAPLVIAAAEAGIHTIVEKPLTPSLLEADRMIAATTKANTRAACIFQRRFYPAAQRIRNAIDDGRLGKLTLSECIARIHRDRAYFDHDEWRGKWGTEGGGVLMNQAVHIVDLMQWYMGPAVEVYGRWSTLLHGDYIEVEDTTVATIAFASGALGMIECASTFTPPVGFVVTIHGTSGAAVGIRESPEGSQAYTDLWSFEGEEEQRAEWEKTERGGSAFPDFHRLQLQDFLHAIMEDRPPAVTIEDGRKSIEIIQAIYLSEKTRQPVKLPMNPADVVIH
ncbi:MAG TPA: Gfo/Idh/MocA family oxidoreductase [Candidatus Dormibacteraeota bacterium]|jgi:predicted dehydrogenase|nr:Gfo/Idh/MocA family oxidoreductase [Candidatus Dormibacteraeota bacterium]